MVKIKHRYTGATLYSGNHSTMRLAVDAALKRKADLHEANLSEADLSGADLSEADLSGADLRRADLSGADLRWADLSGADLRRADLSEADLSEADLSGADLRWADLRWTNLSGADLRGADLRGTALNGADLRTAGLSRADLSRARLRGARLPPSPIVEGIHKAVAEAVSAEGSVLEMDSWHGFDGHCGTEHCRAGWATHLAGEAGKALEDTLGTSAAAALIYQSSDPSLERVPDFFASNEEALADINRLAGESK